MSTGQTPSLLRRLAAVAYDTLILAALLIAATAATLLFTRGEPVSAGTLWYQFYLGTIVLIYFSVSWWRRGQTIGMVAWRLRVRTAEHANASLFQCVLRALSATISWLALGLGFLWVLIDRRGRAWHDLLSGTELVLEIATGVSAREPAQQR
ncbi:MAG: RDD family protein [Gammaproteobacteria bacterium]|nr:RDD family protein [Gammaproteobacteria bacterium]